MKRRGRRVPPALVALSSAAIMAVYAAGYLRTEGVASAPATTPSPVPYTPEPLTPRIGIGAPIPPTQPPSNPTPAPRTQPQVAYKDGTYRGLGMSRHGDIGVSVTVSGGRITSVTINACLTRYPCSVISGLPGQVVSRQKASVDAVSGATDSSDAFQQAVANALRNAQ